MDTPLYYNSAAVSAGVSPPATQHHYHKGGVIRSRGAGVDVQHHNHQHNNRTSLPITSDHQRNAFFTALTDDDLATKEGGDTFDSYNGNASTAGRVGAGAVNGRTYGVVKRQKNTTNMNHKKPAPPSPPPKPLNHHSWPYHSNNNAPDLYYVDEKQSKKKTSKSGSVDQGTLEQHPFFSRDVQRPETMRETRIVSSRGTVRGYKNRVRAGIANILDTDKNKALRQQERGRIVLYTTSMSVVRETFDQCSRIRRILQTHMVQFEERDIFMSKHNQEELTERLGIDLVTVPHVFADGNHLGNGRQIDEYNESGQLKQMFASFPKVVTSSSCQKCGGYRFVNCSTCHGSKKSLTRNNFTAEFSALRCVACNENGLVPCDQC